MNKHIFRGKKLLVSFIPAILLSGVLMPQVINADFEASALNTAKIVKTVKMMVTAYSSTPDQTDETPFITASGKEVREGIVANNMLPFGTKVRIPKLYGDKVFTIEDRMHKRKGQYQVDIWMPSYSQAKNFGAKITEIEILEN